DALARAEGLRRHGTDACDGTSAAQPGEDVNARIEAAAAAFGFEAEPVDIGYADFSRFVRTCGPAIIRAAADGLVVLDSQGRVIAPDLSERSIAASELRSAVFHAAEETARTEADRLLHGCSIALRRAARARKAIARERLVDVRASGVCWQLRVPPDGRFQPHA